jgi:hypothetical protein
MELSYLKYITTDVEQKILENDLLDIKDWIDKAIEGKINNCLKRAASQFDQVAIQKSLETVPAKIEKKVEELFKQPDYKNRAQRETNVTQSI